VSVIQIVVPCYDEADRLDFEAFGRALVAQADLHLLFVDDGSRDATRSLLEGFEQQWPGRVSLLALGRNAGKAAAVTAGVRAAFEREPNAVGYWDADLAAPLDELPRFVACLEHDPSIEIVLGSRVRLLGRTIDRLATRHYLGRLAATMAAWALGIPVYDTQCGAKLMRVTDRTRVLFDEPFRAGWTFDVELIARWLRDRRAEGAPSPEEGLLELPLDVWRHVPGSKVRAMDLPRALLDLWRVRRRYR